MTFPETLVVAARLVERDPLRREPASARRASTAPASPRPASRPRGSCRARSCPTTTTPTPTPPSSWSPNSPSRRSRSSSTPTRAASRSAASLREAWDKALACDPVSAFGGIVAVNRPLDAATAEAIAEDLRRGRHRARGRPGGARRCSPRKEALRLLVDRRHARPDGAGSWTIARSPAGCWSRSATGLTATARRSEGRHQARADRGRDRRPAVRRHGRQARQVERDRLRPRRRDGRHRRRPDEPRRQRPHRRRRRRRRPPPMPGCREPRRPARCVASDAFYPFADGLEAAIAAGATAAIQPGGSRRDAEVIAAADAAGIAMVFTGLRHFRH